MQLAIPGSLNYKLIAQINKSLNHLEKENILETEQSKKALFTQQGFEAGLERQLGFRWSDSRSEGRTWEEVSHTGSFSSDGRFVWGNSESWENRLETDFKWSTEQG